MCSSDLLLWLFFYVRLIYMSFISRHFDQQYVISLEQSGMEKSLPLKIILKTTQFLAWFSFYYQIFYYFWIFFIISKKKYTFTELNLFFAKMRFFLKYIIIQALKVCNILRSVKVYFFWKISISVEVRQKSHWEKTFRLRSRWQNENVISLERSVMEKSQPHKKHT